MALLLDTYTGAVAAYSVRLLDEDYSGPLVKIRRSSDDATKDFYPDSNDELSLSSEDGASTSLSSWIGSNSGYIDTWYDQSGNGNDMAQATTNDQPPIIESGAFVTAGDQSKPAIKFSGTQWLQAFSNTTAPTEFQSLSDAISIFATIYNDTNSGAGSGWWPAYVALELRESGTGCDIPFCVGLDSNKFACNVSDDYTTGADLCKASTTLSDDTHYRLSAVISGDSVTFTNNGSSDGSVNFVNGVDDRSVSTNNASFTLASRAGNTGAGDLSLFRGYLQEIIVFGSAKTGSDLSGINADIAGYFVGAYEEEIADTWTATDAATDIQNYVDTIADSAAWTDILTVTIPGEIVDTWAITDAVVDSQDYVDTIADSITWTDSLVEDLDTSHEFYDYLPTCTADVDITLDLYDDIRPWETIPFWGEKAQITHKKDNGAISVYTIDDQAYFYMDVYFKSLNRNQHGFIFDLYYNSTKANGSENTFYVVDPDGGKTYIARFMEILKSRLHAKYGRRYVEIEAIRLRIECRKAIT